MHLQFQQQSSLAAAAPATAQKALVAGKYLLGLGGVAAASQSETVAEKARLAYLIPVRLIRDVYTAASIVTGEEHNARLPACFADWCVVKLAAVLQLICHESHALDLSELL